MGHALYCQPVIWMVLEILIVPLLWSVLEFWLRKRRSIDLIFNGCLFLVSLLGIVYMTLMHRAVGNYALNLQPFQLLIGAMTWRKELWRSLLLNILLFTSFGASFSNLLPQKRPKWSRILIVTLLGLLLSIGIEYGQYYWCIGEAETDDVICNTLGALIGSLSLLIPERWFIRRKKEAVRFKPNWVQHFFLLALGAALKNEHAVWKVEITAEEWQQLFYLAEQQNVLPMIYEAVYTCDSAQSISQETKAALKRETLHRVMAQTIKTADFLQLYKFLNSKGLQPIVVKGIVCRNLYPLPDHRLSSDEDLLVPTGKQSEFEAALEEFGMERVKPTEEPEDSDVSWFMKTSPLYLEEHPALFPAASEAYGDLNRFFEDCEATAVELNIEGVSIRSLNPTQHCFYLITHSLKHFLHSGFGIRQVADLGMFANAYGSQIDWDKVWENCKAIQAEQFAAAMLKIANKDLGINLSHACLTDVWKNAKVDEGQMLADILNAGVFGGATMSRKHSSNITLEAVIAQKNGKKGNGSGLSKSLFPPFAEMCHKYLWLNDKPYLLPAAWIIRILQYLKETAGSHNNSAAEAVKIGNDRVELLKQYGIIK